MKHLVLLIGLLLFSSVAFAQETETPTATPTNTVTPTRTNTPTKTPTVTVTPTFTLKPTLTQVPATATRTIPAVATPNRTVTPSRENGTHFTNVDLDNHSTLIEAAVQISHKPETCKLFVAANHLYLACPDGTIRKFTDSGVYP
jgi:hypothetical protein